MTDAKWRDSARCAGMGPLLFFGPQDELPSERIRRERRAKLFCNGCKVQGYCRLEGMNEEGIWGGMTDAERRRAHRTPAYVPPFRRVEAPAAADEVGEGWVLLESSGSVVLYRRDDATSWHGSSFVILKNGHTAATTYDLADAYMRFNSLLP